MVSKDIWLKSVKDDAGVYHMLNYTAGKEKGSRLYKDLSEEEQDLVKQTVFITDKFCIEEAAYHERSSRWS